MTTRTRSGWTVTEWGPTAGLDVPGQPPLELAAWLRVLVAGRAADAQDVAAEYEQATGDALDLVVISLRSQDRAGDTRLCDKCAALVPVADVRRFAVIEPTLQGPPIVVVGLVCGPCGDAEDIPAEGATLPNGESR